MATAALTTDVASHNGVVRVKLTGELDLATAPILQQQLDLIAADIDAILVDLQDVTFVDSSGLSVFLRAWELSTARGGTFGLTGIGPSAHRLLEVTKTQFLADVSEADRAMQRFSGASEGAGPDRRTSVA